MKRSTLLWLAGATLAFAVPAVAQPPEKIVGRQEAASEVGLSGLQIGADGSVQGTIVNNTHGVLKSVKLLVKHAWYWKNERHPGDDSPGRSAYIAVPGEIAPGASAPVSYTPDPPLAKRSDGTFQTSVGVQSFEQVGE